MNVYGNTCPMCCGDIDSTDLTTTPGQCTFCGYGAGKSMPTPRQPAAIAFIPSAVAEGGLAIPQALSLSPFSDMQSQPGASMAPTEFTNT